MLYFSDKIVTIKDFQQVLNAVRFHIDIINDTTPKNLNANFYTVAQMGAYQKAYKLHWGTTGIPWVEVLDNYSKTQGYPVPIPVYVKKDTKYKVATWIITEKDFVIKLQDHSNKVIATKQVSKIIGPQRVILEFTAKDTRPQNFRLFFEGDFKGINFTKFSIERVV